MSVRIAYVAPSFGEAEGQGRVNLEIVSRLIARGCSITVLTSRIPSSGLPGATVRVAPRPFGAELPNQIVFVLWATLQIARGRYDVVHADGASLLTRADVVAAHLLHALASPSKTKETGLRGLYHSASDRLNRVLERRAYASARLIIANSERTATDLQRTFGIDASRIRVMPLGVDTERFTPPTDAVRADARARLGATSDEFIAVLVGAAEPRKGVPNVIEALASLPGVQLVLVGDPRDGRLVAQGRRKGLRIDVLPWPSDPIAAYHAADVLLAPAVYEPFGLSVLEGMACGLPVVVAQTAGVASVCNGSAIAIPPTAAAIRSAVLDLHRDAERRIVLGKQGRIIAEGRIWDATADAVQSAYAEVAR